jgi:hypothetical protein
MKLNKGDIVGVREDEKYHPLLWKQSDLFDSSVTYFIYWQTESYAEKHEKSKVIKPGTLLIYIGTFTDWNTRQELHKFYHSSGEGFALREKDFKFLEMVSENRRPSSVEKGS